MDLREKGKPLKQIQLKMKPKSIPVFGGMTEANEEQEKTLIMTSASTSFYGKKG